MGDRPLKHPKQEAFAQGIAKGMTADAAYTAAGYTPNPGNATRLKLNEAVASRVKYLVGRGAEKAEIDIARVLRELARVGTSDVRRLFDASGQLLPVTHLDDDTAAAISSVEVVTRRIPGEDGAEVEYVHKMRFWDKNSALEKIGKHLAMFVDRVEHAGPGGESLIPDTLKTASSEEIERRIEAYHKRNGLK